MTDVIVSQQAPATKQARPKPTNNVAAKPRNPAMKEQPRKTFQKRRAVSQAAPTAATPDQLQKLVARFAK